MKKIIKKILPEFIWCILQEYRSRQKDRKSAKRFLDKIRKSNSPILTNTDKSIIDELPKKLESVLDVGSGGGRLLLWFAYNGYKIIGIEPDAWYRNLVNKFIVENTLKNCQIINGDIHEINYPDKSFDVIVCSEVLEHIKDPEQGIAEMARVAKKRIIITVPVGHSFDNIGHIHHFARQDIDRLFVKYDYYCAEVYTKEADRATGNKNFLICIVF
ncbi:hypothetical protein CL633_01615 [bacterium]|nr:hypothetical protein [bacterium]|tara:strand:+ start:7877 stop:8521 length:645 start_codon:yes stop_codon:yes gene_type:complete